MAGRPRAVVQDDHVGLLRPDRGLGPDRPDAEADRDPVAPEGLEGRFSIARVVGRDQPGAGLDDRGRHPEAGVDLGQLDSGRAAAQDEEAGRQLPGPGRIPVRPGPDALDPLDRRDLRDRADRQEDVARFELVARVVVADLDPARTGQPAGAPEHGRPGLLEAAHVPAVVGIGDPLAIDHVVAPVRGALPGVVGARSVPLGSVEQGLRRDTAPERAGSAEQVAIDHGHAGAPGSRLVGGRLTGRAGADDHEVEGVHRSPSWRLLIPGLSPAGHGNARS